jgi:hypothetical protein
LGANASGKTSVLEAIGYFLALLTRGENAVLAYALTTTLRPRNMAPSPMYISGSLQTFKQSMQASTLYVEMKPLLALQSDETFRKVLTSIEYESQNVLRIELAKDFRAGEALAYALIGAAHPPISRLLKQKETLSTLLYDFTVKILGGRVRAYSASAYFRKSISGRVVTPDYLERMFASIILRPHRMQLAYVMIGSKIMKSIILERANYITLLRGAEAEPPINVFVGVFHPGFIYWRGMFESLYYSFIRRGFVREGEAIELLRNYIRWFNGFEIVGRELHVKTVDGRRVSVYDLSDGHRVAAFLGVLYAGSEKESVFLIDTPEAFMHPDGLPLVADLLVRLASMGSQVVVATQSLEFLEQLLRKAKDYGVLEDTIVKQLHLSEKGVVEPSSQWSGHTALESMEELGADLRR